MREDRIKILKQIPKELYNKINLFTRQDRVEELSKHIPKGIKITPNPMDIDGIADIRQRCIDKVPKGKVWIIDDLCSFQKRGKSASLFNNEDFMELYHLVESKLDNYPQVVISPKRFNNYRLNDFDTCFTAYSTFGLRTDVIDKLGIRFDGMYIANKKCRFMEDLFVTMSLHTRGLCNVMLNNFTFAYEHNRGGGNSTDRQTGGHNASVIEIQKYFPKYIKIRQVKGSWGKSDSKDRWDPMNDRYECKCSWRKAYEDNKPKKI